MNVVWGGSTLSRRGFVDRSGCVYKLQATPRCAMFMHNRVQFAMLEQLNFISRQYLTPISNADYIFRDFYDYKLLSTVRSLQSNRLITGLFGKVFRGVGIRKI
jgi:hypothetical protein